MTGAVLVLIAILFLLVGFVLGNMKMPQISSKKQKAIERIAADIRREYENFLTYDGTEQQ